VPFRTCQLSGTIFFPPTLEQANTRVLAAAEPQASVPEAGRRGGRHRSRGSQKRAGPVDWPGDVSQCDQHWTSFCQGTTTRDWKTADGVVSTAMLNIQSRLGLVSMTTDCVHVVSLVLM